MSFVFCFVYQTPVLFPANFSNWGSAVASSSTAFRVHKNLLFFILHIMSRAKRSTVSSAKRTVIDLDSDLFAINDEERENLDPQLKQSTTQNKKAKQSASSTPKKSERGVKNTTAKTTQAETIQASDNNNRASDPKKVGSNPSEETISLAVILQFDVFF